jgi:hypothetical protein
MNRNINLAAGVAVVALSLGMSFAAQAEATGKIKICRLSIPGADKSAQYIPADGTWGGACDSNGANCRSIVVAAIAGANLKAGQSCVELAAKLVQEDGQPLNAGQSLIPSWDTGSFESNTTVTKSFK